MEYDGTEFNVEHHLTVPQFGMGQEGNEAGIVAALARAHRSAQGVPFTYLELGIYQCGTLMGVCRVLEQLSGESRVIGLDVGDHGVRPTPWFEGLYAPLAGTAGAAGEKKVRAWLHWGDREALRPPGVLSGETCHAVLIDGCHCAACCREDFLAVEPRVAPGGVVLFHDASPLCDGALQGNWHGAMTIEVRPVLRELGLLDNTRPGWRLLADLTRVPFGMAIVQRRETE